MNRVEASQLFSSDELAGKPRGYHVAIWIATIVMPLVAMLVLNSSTRTPAFAAAGLLLVVVLVGMAVYAGARPARAACFLLMVEMLASASFLPDELRTAARYGLLATFALPALRSAFGSGILRRGGFKLYAIYFGWALVTVTYSLLPLYSLGRVMISGLLFLAIAGAVSEVENRDDAYEVVGQFVLGSAVVVILVAASAILLPGDVTWLDDPDAGIMRFRGFFNSPNQIGGLMLITVGAVAAYWPAARGRKRFGLIVVVSLALALGLMADSRSGFVALGVGALLFFVWKYKARGLLGAIAALLMLAIAAIFHAGSGTSEYVARGDVTTLTGRTEVWHFALRQIAQSPLLGWGYEVEGQIFQSKYFPLWWGPWDDGPYSSLHNGYLGHAVGVGIPATLLWLFVVLRPLVALFRSSEDPWQLKPVALLCLVPVMVQNLAETTAGDCRNGTGLLLVIAWALLERERLLIATLRVVRAKSGRSYGPIAAVTAAFLGAVVVLTARPASARDSYVDASSGLDTNSGTSPQTALRSLGAVQKLRLGPGDRMLLARGRVWRDSLNIDPPWIGTTDAPIVLSTYGTGAAPIITGTELVSSFTRSCGGRCYAAEVRNIPQRLFVDGDGFSSNHQRTEPDDLVPGSWALRGNTLYLILAGNDSPTLHRIEVTTRQWGVRCWGCQHVSVRGLEICGTWDDGINFDGSLARAKAASDLAVTDCRIHDIGRGNYDETGIQAGSTFAISVTAERNVIYRIGLGQGFGSKIGRGGIGILFNRCEGCVARDNDVSGAGHIGIAAQLTEDTTPGPQPHNVTIAGNRVHDCPGAELNLDRADAIYLRRASDVSVDKNRIWNIDSPSPGAGNAIHIGPRCAEIRVTRNSSRSCAGGIYLDGNQVGQISVTANTFGAMSLFFARVFDLQPGEMQFDRNQYESPASATGFVVGTDTRRLGFSQWQSLGLDPGGACESRGPS